TGYVFLFGAWHNRESRLAKLDEHAFTEQETKAQLSSLLNPYPRLLTGLDAFFEGLARPLRAFRARRALEQLEAGTFYGRDTPVVVKRPDLRVVKGKTYRVALTKRGGSIRWELDGQPGLVQPESASALIEAVAGGDQRALAGLYDRYAAALLAAGQRTLRSRREAEDVLHDVFVEVWQQAGDYDPGRGSVKAWLFLRM